MEENIKVIRTRHNTLFLFFGNELGIHCSRYENEGWLEPELIIPNVHPEFSVSVSSNDVIYILCRDKNNKIFICRKNETDIWESKPLIESKYTITPKFYLSTNKSNMNLIYNTPTDDPKINYINYTSLNKGNWDKLVKIDAILPFDNSPYIINTIEDNHIIIFCRTDENTINCREVLLSPFTLGTLNTVARTNSYPILDFSTLITNDKIHMVFLIKTRFSYQLVYKSKVETQISQPVVLWEGQKADSCSIFSCDKKVHIVWTNGNQCFSINSENDCQSFSRAQRVPYQLPNNTVKVEYINANINEKHIFNSSELYVDRDNKTAIQVVNLFDKHFYPESKDSLNLTAASAMEYNNNLTLKENIEVLKNKIIQYETTLSENNNQLTELTKSLSEKSKETNALNSRWTDRCKNLEYEITRLNSELLVEKSKNLNYEKTISNIQLSLDEATSSLNLVKNENIALKKTKELLEDELYRINTPTNIETNDSIINETEIDSEIKAASEEKIEE